MAGHSAQGLPVRVIDRHQSPEGQVTSTTDILAVNVPVTTSSAPARSERVSIEAEARLLPAHFAACAGPGQILVIK